MEFDPPAWMIPLFASAGRAGRTYADVIGEFADQWALPEGAISIRIPRSDAHGP